MEDGPSESRIRSQKRSVMFRKPLILDGVYFIGNEYVGCHVIDTGEGYILLDCICDSDWYYEMIQNGFEGMDLDIKGLRYIFVSHCHFNHYGMCGNSET